MIGRRISLLLLAAILATGVPGGARADDVPRALPSFAEPAISPDGDEIAFVSGGDIWSVPAQGGDAHLLVAAGGYASRPLFSPDGKQLAFVSSRPGATGIYVVTLAGGAQVRLTHDDAAPLLSAWSADSHDLYFSTSAWNLEYFQDVMRVAAGGGTPMRVVTEPYVNSMDGVPSPDGRTIAYERNGFLQWWRRGHAHIDQASLVIYDPAAKHYDSITPGDAKDRWPMWSPDASTLYFVSDRSGHDEIWTATGHQLRKRTALDADVILWPTIARNGRTIAFEHDFGIWTYDTATGATRAVPIALRGAPEDVPVAHVTLSARFSDLALAPDGKKIAFVARGRVFAASASDGGDAQPVPLDGVAAQVVPVWAPGSRRIAFTVDRGTETALALYDFPDGPARTITPPGHFDDYPNWSPDGKTLAFVRDGRELRVIDIATKAERVLATATLDRRPFGDLHDLAFSPAGDLIAFISDLHARGFASLSVVPVNGGEPRTITDLPDGNAGSVVWSPDATRIYMLTGQRTEEGHVAQIDLVPRAPHFREDAYRRLFDEPKPVAVVPSPAPSASASPAPAPAHRTTIAYDGIFTRLTLLETGLDTVSLRITPDGKTLLLAAQAAGQENLYTYGVDDTSTDPSVPHQITSTSGNKTDLAIVPDGKSAMYLDSGRIFTVPIGAPGAPRPLAVSAALDVDFNAEKDLVFRQAWSLLDRWYADPDFHGADWTAQLLRFEPHARGAATPLELRRVISLMLGQLNSSHLGIYAPPSGVPRATGRLGVQFDTAAYERTGRLRIAELLPLGPLALAGHVAVGDEIVAIDGRPLERNVDIDAALADKAGARTVVRIAPHGDAAAARDVVVLPVDRVTEGRLRYAAWVESRRAYVDRISGGRLGYVHLVDMSEESLHRLYRDLDVRNRTKDGVVIDIRNNQGGFVDPYALDVLTRREYLTFKPRFGSTPPERSALGQRALDRPSVLVTNEHSLSDAENFTEGYRVLRAGSVVGTPTAGWIIFTDSAMLADGSTLRLPSVRTIAHDGVDMELHPRPVDVYVENPPGAADRGDDPQLDAAVRVLLGRLRHSS